MVVKVASLVHFELSVNLTVGYLSVNVICSLFFADQEGRGVSNHSFYKTCEKVRLSKVDEFSCQIVLFLN